jgi:fumarate hydratase class II
MISPKQAAARKIGVGPESHSTSSSAWLTIQDELGEVNIPRHQPFGPHTWRAFRSIAISERKTPAPLLEAMLRVKWACAFANQICGALEASVAHQIQESVKEILLERTQAPMRWAQRFPLDYWQSGAGTNINMNVNETIAHHANGHRWDGPIRSHDHVNRSQSSNSVFPTALRLALLSECKPLLHELHLLSQVIHNRATDWKTIEKPARTHLQDAVPTTVGQEWRAWGQALQRCQHWIGASRTELLKIALDAGAAGTGLNVPHSFGLHACEKLRELTREPQLTNESDHGSDFLQSAYAPIQYHSQLTLLTCELYRITSDLRLLASGPRCGLGELRIAPVHAGSSMMPGKTNPSILELAAQIHFRVLGNQNSLLQAFQNGQLDLNVMTPIIATLALESTDLVTHTLRLLRTEVIETLELNHPRLQEFNRLNLQKATALTPRYGHKQVGEWIQEAQKKGVTLEEILPPTTVQELKTKGGLSDSP